MLTMIIGKEEHDKTYLVFIKEKYIFIEKLIVDKFSYRIVHR